MRITNVETGEALQLTPDTKLSVERTNPFFNDYGEQTVPLDIPASPHNCRILKHPEAFGVKRKAIMVDAIIQDGEYYAQCRQAVLSATRHGNISTSFYMNDGSLYSRIGNLKLRDIYGDERIAAAGNTVTSCIAWCKTLVNNTDPDYTIFPVLLTDDSNMDTGWNYKILNNYGSDDFVVWIPEDGDSSKYVRKVSPLFSLYGSTPFFENERDSVEYVDGIAINLKPGYYISPFIRAVRVLRDVFSYFGYTLLNNFFTQTEPFSKMAIVNNCIDTIINGYILKADLVPDITCKDFLAVFRKKFCCEFVADESDMTVSVVFLRDVLDQSPSVDLTQKMTEEPTFHFKTQKDYKRVKLSSESKVDQESSDSFDNVKDLRSNHETAIFCPIDGSFYKRGWKGSWAVETKVGECSMDYDTGDEEDVVEVTIPEQIPEYRILTHVCEKDDDRQEMKLGYYLYVGNYIARHSLLKMPTETSDEDETTDSDTKSSQCPCMLVFTHTDASHIVGTAGSVSAYNLYSRGAGVNGVGSSMIGRYNRLWDYSLFYYGEYGIFERFYRQMDTLRRNTLNEVKVKLLLSDHDKITIPACRKVCIRSESFLIDKFKFTLGGKDEPQETQLLTLSLGEPLSSAKTIEQMLPMMTAQYKWEPRESTSVVYWYGWDDETDSPYHGDGEFHSTVYPVLPTAALYGQTCGEQFVYVLTNKEGPGMYNGILCYRYTYWKIRAWLVCVQA